MNASVHRSGYVAIVGRPNVGKSTLLNRLVGMNVSITSRRPQTTRHRITGIVSEPDAQLVLVDTPGFQTAHGGALNKLMNRVVTDSLEGVDVTLFVVEAGTFGADDRKVLALLPKRIPVVLVINKIDRAKDKSRLLPFIARVSTEFEFAEVVPVSASKGTQVARLLDAVKPYLPEGPAPYGEDEVTDRPERFLAAELLREKLFRLLGEELPYAATVVVEKFEIEAGLRRIHAAIVVDKPNHKAMVIGKGGAKLKDIATQARVDMEKLFGGKVFLEVWVRVKSGWAESLKALKNLGYE
ncbi:MAG TPA: GTPase Era [Burkholderiales bacterium]|jgi:GTP-binding protein Era|nr:GTPase Era [Burkholderiales bacterium]